MHHFFRIVFVLVATAAFSFSFGQTLTVGTYNIRYDSRDDARQGNGWKDRSSVIGDLIKFHRFDVLGLQEALDHQLADLRDQLPDFEHVGVGRDDGARKGEHSPIFYRKDKFQVLDSGTFWLSPTPEQVGVVGWDAALPRICTWARFQESAEKKRTFWVFNTHFDHRGTQARLESARLMLKMSAEMAKDEPVILTGDFNVTQTSESYRELEASEMFADAYEIAGIRYAKNGTFNNFDPNSQTDSRIDHVFLTKHFSVVRYGVLLDSYRARRADGSEGSRAGNAPEEVRLHRHIARLPSDHFPVLAELELAP